VTRVRVAVVFVVAAGVLAGGAGLALRNRRPASLREQALWVLEAPDALELFALDPFSDHAPDRPGERFHGFIVLGRAAPDGIPRQQVARALWRGLRSDEPLRECFYPRHGARAFRGAKAVELVVCVTCGHAVIHASDSLSADVETTDAPEVALDQALMAAGAKPFPRLEDLLDEKHKLRLDRLPPGTLEGIRP